MAEKFDIIDYLSGLTGFVFDIAVLKRVALDRGVLDVESYSALDDKKRELLRADLLYEAYMSPNVWASSTNSHGSYTKTIGPQTIYSDTKEKIYNTILSIYKKYEDPKLEEIVNSDGTVQFIDDYFI